MKSFFLGTGHQNVIKCKRETLDLINDDVLLNQFNNR